jgi:hypothetical protein
MVEKRLQITRSLIQANEPDLQHSIPGQMGAVTHIHAGRPGDVPISATLADVPECSPVRMSMLIWWCPVSLSCGAVRAGTGPDEKGIDAVSRWPNRS